MGLFVGSPFPQFNKNQYLAGNKAALAAIMPGGPSTSQIGNPAPLFDARGRQVAFARSTANYCRKSLVFDPSNIQPNYETASAGSGASVVSGQVAPDGTASANQMTDSGGVGFHGASAPALALAGATYTASLHIKYSNCRYVSLIAGNTGTGCSFDVLNGVVANQDSGFTGAITLAGNGYYRVSITHVFGAGSETLYALLNPNNSGGTPSYAASGKQAYFWGWKVELGASATAYTSPMLVTIPAAIPRVEPEGMLIEGISTNLALQSQTFDNAYWTKIASGTIPVVTADQWIAPDGTLTADKVVFTAQSIGNYSLLRSSNITATAASYTASVYVYSTSNQTIYISANSGGNYTACSLIANTWTRCADTRALSAATFTMDIGWNVAGVTPPSTTVYVWGAQFELSARATSYIPTVGSSVPRNNDSASILCDFNALDGSVAATITPSWTGAGSGGGEFIVTTGASATNLAYQPGDTHPNCIIPSSGFTACGAGGDFVINTPKRYAIRWGAGQFSIGIVGGTPNTGTFTAFSAQPTGLRFGASGGFIQDGYWITNIILASGKFVAN